MRYDQTREQVMAREAQARLLARACGGNGEEILSLAYHALLDAKCGKEAQRLVDIMDELYE